jgi:hypothetical protein
MEIVCFENIYILNRMPLYYALIFINNHIFREMIKLKGNVFDSVMRYFKQTNNFKQPDIFNFFRPSIII